MFDTPILLIIFNRPDTTRRVFETIKLQKPKYLFVAADGPRPDKPDDIAKCHAARNEIKVDWDCELKTLYRSKNRGCGNGPAEAITWFFEYVEMGIILEDDIIPHPSFFSFCNEILKKFEFNDHVAMVSGINLISPWNADKASYVFSYMGGIPGWATWRRAWCNFDYSLNGWKTEESKTRIKKLLNNNEAYKHYAKSFDYFSNNNQGDVWDYQWLFSRWNTQGCSIVPCVNLIENIGFGLDATHTKTTDHPQSRIKAEEISFPLKHHFFQIDKEYDQIVIKTYFRKRRMYIPKALINKIKSIILGSNIMSKVRI